MATYKPCSLFQKNKSNSMIAQVMLSLKKPRTAGLVVDDEALNSTFHFTDAIPKYEGTVVNKGPTSKAVQKHCALEGIDCFIGTALEFLEQHPGKQFDLFYLDSCCSYTGSKHKPFFSIPGTLDVYFGSSVAAARSVLAVTIFTGRGMACDAKADISRIASQHGYAARFIAENAYFNMKTLIFVVQSSQPQTLQPFKPLQVPWSSHDHMKGKLKLETSSQIVKGRTVFCEWKTGQFWPARILGARGRDGVNLRFEGEDNVYTVRYRGKKSRKDRPRWIYFTDA